VRCGPSVCLVFKCTSFLLPVKIEGVFGTWSIVVFRGVGNDKNCGRIKPLGLCFGRGGGVLRLSLP